MQKKAYVLSSYNSSFIGFPGGIIDSQKEALSEEQPPQQDSRAQVVSPHDLPINIFLSLLAATTAM